MVLSKLMNSIDQRIAAKSWYNMIYLHVYPICSNLNGGICICEVYVGAPWCAMRMV